LVEAVPEAGINLDDIVYRDDDAEIRVPDGLEWGPQSSAPLPSAQEHVAARVSFVWQASCVPGKKSAAGIDAPWRRELKCRARPDLRDAQALRQKSDRRRAYWDQRRPGACAAGVTSRVNTTLLARDESSRGR